MTIRSRSRRAAATAFKPLRSALAGCLDEEVAVARRPARTRPHLPRAGDRAQVRLGDRADRRPRPARAARPRLRAARQVPRGAHARSAGLEHRPRRSAEPRRGLPDPVDDPLGEGARVGRRLRDPRDRRLHPVRHGDRRRGRARGGAAPALRRAHPGARRARAHLPAALLQAAEAARRRAHVRGRVAVPRHGRRARAPGRARARDRRARGRRRGRRRAPRASTTTWPTCSGRRGQGPGASAQFPPSRFPTIFTPDESPSDDGCGRYGSQGVRQVRDRQRLQPDPPGTREGGQEQPLAAEQLVLDAGHHLDVERHLRLEHPDVARVHAEHLAGLQVERSAPRRPARPRPRTSHRASAG